MRTSTGKTHAGEPVFWNSRTREVAWVDPAKAIAGEWVPVLDAFSREYYYSIKTGASTWTLPSA